MKSEDKILQRIKRLKESKFNKVSVAFNFGANKCYLILLTHECSNNLGLMRLLGVWRRRIQYWFPAQFKVTLSGTISWFDKLVTADPDRMLFIIKAKNDYIGHIGLDKFNLKDNTCEIDNVIRGKALYPGIMSCAMRQLIAWSKIELGIDSNRLEVASDNSHAVIFYNRLGFREVKREPMIHVKDGKKWSWIDAPAGYKKPVKRYNVFMKIQES